LGYIRDKRDHRPFLQRGALSEAGFQQLPFWRESAGKDKEKTGALVLTKKQSRKFEKTLAACDHAILFNNCESFLYTFSLSR